VWERNWLLLTARETKSSETEAEKDERSRFRNRGSYRRRFERPTVEYPTCVVVRETEGRRNTRYRIYVEVRENGGCHPSERITFYSPTSYVSGGVKNEPVASALARVHVVPAHTNKSDDAPRPVVVLKIWPPPGGARLLLKENEPLAVCPANTGSLGSARTVKLTVISDACAALESRRLQMSASSRSTNRPIAGNPPLVGCESLVSGAPIHAS
jgi:hypothetical protein